MQGREAGKATTIMQKFIKGSAEDNIPPMPVVIGMSATTQRFNALVEGTSSTIHKSVVTADEVRASGLLKDRIVITYPEAGSVNNDMAIFRRQQMIGKKNGTIGHSIATSSIMPMLTCICYSGFKWQRFQID